MDTEAVLTLLQDVAAQVIDPRFRALEDDEIASKGPGDPVTVADREAEVLITAALRAAYPDALVLGEEASAGDPGLVGRFAAAEHAFTVDPVDGTKNFVAGSPDHAVMAAELRGGRVVRSWIWQPQHRRAYVAELGAGAWRDGERLTVPPAVPPAGPPAGPEPRGATSRRRWIGRRLGSLPALELTWVCCGVDYPKLVEGEAGFLLYSGVKPWDHAPGSLLLTEAGGWAGSFDGTAYAPQTSPDHGLVAAADRATYDLVHGLLPQLP